MSLENNVDEHSTTCVSSGFHNTAVVSSTLKLKSRKVISIIPVVIVHEGQ